MIKSQKRPKNRDGKAIAPDRLKPFLRTKKISLFLLLLIQITAFSSYAQPNVFKDGGSSGSTFALGSTSARKTQLLYLPTDLTNVKSGIIGKLYFRYSSTSANTLSDFNVRLGQTTNTAFSPSTTFYTGLTTVLTSSSFTIPAGNAGDWLEIPLSSTFNYDATQTLIVELEFSASSSSSFSTRYTTKSGQKLYTSTVTNATGTATTTWQDFGMLVASNGTDITIASLNAGTSTSCFSTTETVEAVISNQGSTTIDFATTPATISASATGANPTTFTPVTINTGTLAPFSTQTVTVTNGFNMSGYGLYNIDATISLTGDVNTANDVAPTFSITNISPAALPVSVDFTGFTGSNLTTVFPDWREGDGATTPDGTTSVWLRDDFANNTSHANGDAARVNLDGATDTEWIVGPKVKPTAATKLRFDLALTEFGNTNATTMGSDDLLQVMVSTDCGNSYTAIRTYSSTTPISNTGQTELIDLSTYAGQDIIIAFFATEGSTNDPEDNDLFIDNIFIGTPPSLDLATSGLVSPALTGCYTSTQPVVVTIQNAATTAIDFSVDPATISVVVGGVVTQTLNTTINTGTLAPGATLDVAAGTLNMAAPGNYTFDITTTVTGDGLAANNTLPTETRTVDATVSLPQTVDFTGFTGTNLTTLFPNWREGDGATTPNGTSSSWDDDDFANDGSSINGVSARFNLYGSTDNDWIVGPKITATSTTALRFDLALTEFSNTNATTMGPGDELRVMISTDCGNSYTPLTIYSSSTPISNTGQTELINLSTYAGQDIILAFMAVEGTAGFTRDINVYIDNIFIGTPPSLDVATSALVSPIEGSCFGNAEPVVVSIDNLTSNTLDFSVDPATVTVTIGGAVTQTLTVTINSGTLAGGTSQNINLGNLNMSLPGNYTFDASVAVNGDGNPNNDTLATITINNTVISTFPHIQDFESFTPNGGDAAGNAGWTGSTTGFVWEIESGTSGSTGTGPSADHTSGTSSGNYVFTETSSSSTGDLADLITPCIDLSGQTGMGLEFWYHMYGATIETLNVDVLDGGTWVTLFTISGQQQFATTDAWKKATINLNAYSGDIIKIRFQGESGSSFTGDIAIDDFRIFQLPPNDLKLTEVILPESGCGLTNQETIEAVITNIGSASQTNFPVKYSINNGPVQTVNYSGTIAPGVTDTLILTTTANFSTVGTYSVTVYTDLSGDTDTSNDTIANLTLDNILSVSTYPYIEDFENGNGSWTSGGANSSWALGTPANSVINAAASGTNAWITNLTGNYNSDEESFVMSPCFDLTGLNMPVVEMKVWWQSESGWDGAVLQATTDNGATWTTIGANNDPNNWYNNASIDGLAWSGTQEGWSGRNSSSNGSSMWLTAKHDISALVNQPSVRFRIAFGSDGGVQDNGFAFDDFKVLETPLVNLGNDTTLCAGTLTLDAGNPGATFTWNTGATTQTIQTDTSGTFIVVVDANGLTATDTIHVTINDLPVIALGNDTTLCAGSNLVLDAGNAGATYTWNTGATTQTISVSTAGIYWVDVTNSTNCTSRDSIQVSISALPTVSLGADITQCGGSVTLDAGNAGATYVWSDNSTTQTLDVFTSGTYWVDVTSAAGCTTRDSVNITINALPVANLGADISICAGTTATLDAGNAGAVFAWSTGASTQSIVISNAGIYWVDVTNTNGCTSRDSITVTSNPLPTVNIGNDTSICTGATLTLNAGNTGATYLWSDNSTAQTLVVNTPGTYFVDVTNTNGCSSRDSVTVGLRQAATSSFTAVLAGLGSTFTNTGSTGSGFTYSWDFGDATTSTLENPTHTYAATGTYTVTLTVTGPCGAVTSSQTISIVSVKGQLAGKTVHVYPNPTNGLVQVELKGYTGSVDLLLYNATGQEVLTSQVKADTDLVRQQLDLSQMPTGVYILRAISQQGIQFHKIILE